MIGTDPPTRILSLVGSLRSGSVNAAVARAAADLAAPGVQLVPHDLADLPLYVADLDVDPRPAAVVALTEAVAASDGIAVFSPEYNGSYPAVTKNAIDWLSRPPRVWEGKGLTLVVTTPGPRAGEYFRGHFDATISWHPIRHFPSLGIGEYGEKLGPGPELVDEGARAALADHIVRFAAFCRAG